MEDRRSIVTIAANGLRGAGVGLLVGGAVGGLLGTAIEFAIDLFDKTQRVAGFAPWVCPFICLVLYGTPGNMIAGAAGAVSQFPIIRITASLSAGLLPTLLLSFEFWTCTDVSQNCYDWPYYFLEIGGGSLAAGVAAGAAAAWYSSRPPNALAAT